MLRLRARHVACGNEVAAADRVRSARCGGEDACASSGAAKPCGAERLRRLPVNGDRQPDGWLLLTHDSSLASRWAIAITIIMLATAGYDEFIGTRGDDRLVALLASAALTAVMALVLLEQSRFRIDPATRLIEWDKRWG